jgi:hypothetical protein
MAAAIDTQIKKTGQNWGASSKEHYNGVDVDNVYHPKRRQGESFAQYTNRKKAYTGKSVESIQKWISLYLVKYVTKNDIKMSRLPWHCSRSISELFDAEIITDIREIKERKEQILSGLKYKSIAKEHLTHYVFMEPPDNRNFNFINYINNLIINEL